MTLSYDRVSGVIQVGSMCRRGRGTARPSDLRNGRVRNDSGPGLVPFSNLRSELGLTGAEGVEPAITASRDANSGGPRAGVSTAKPSQSWNVW